MRFSGRCFWAIIAVLHLLFLRRGLWTNDEGAYLLLTRSVVENFPRFLNLSAYIPEPGAGAYYSYFRFNGEVHAGISPGLSLLSAPLYLLLGELGIKLVSTAASIGTACLLYRLASARGEEYGRFAALTYTVATPALFYATSLWYHSLAAFFFTLSIYSVIERGRHAHLLLPLSCSLMVLSAYYLLLPAAILVIGYSLSLRNRKSIICLLGFGAMLLPSLAYNAANFGSPLTAEYSAAPLLEVAGGGTQSLQELITRIARRLPALLFSAELGSGEYAWAQKALFQSSPVLALSMVWLHRARRLRLPLLSAGMLLLLTAYAAGDLGGWQLSMRYLLPIFPLLCLALTELLGVLRIPVPEKTMLAMIAMAPLLLLVPLEPSSTAYMVLKIIATFSAISGMIYAIRAGKHGISAFLTILLLISAFSNLNDASYSASYRSTHRVIDSALEGTHTTLYIPAFPPFAAAGAPATGLFLPGKRARVYQPGELPELQGEVSLVGRRDEVPAGCRVESTRSFSSPYRYLVRAREHREMLRRLEKLQVMNLRCKEI